MIVFILFEVLFFAFLLAADLVSKHYIMPFLEAKGNYILINKVITLTPAYNDGAGFSFLAGKTAALIAITSIGLAVILGLIIFGHIKLDLKNKRARFLMSILIMMFAGGLGNLVDRCAFGYVRDFIDYTIVYTIFKRDFAVCNVADIWLTVGMILVVVFVIFLWKGNMLKTAQIVPDDTNAKTAARLLAKMDEKDAIQQQTSDSMIASDIENSMADDTNYTNNTDGDANIEIESQNYTNSIENSDTNKVSGQANAVQDGVEGK